MEPTRPEMRPLGVGEMVDAAIRLYRTNFLTLIKISAVILGPIGLIQLVATIAVGPVDLVSLVAVDPEANPIDVFEPLIPIYTVLAITSLFSFLGSVLVEGASLTVLAHSYRGEEVDWTTSLRVGWGRFIPLIAATFLVSLGSGIGLIFCLVPGVFLFTMWSVTPAALVTERLGPLAAMGRSFRLVKGRFWPVLGAIVLAYLLYMIANQIIGAVTGVATILGSMNGDEISFLPSVIGSALVSIIAAPFLAAMITVIYFDLRVRKEGYDLELMARDLRQMEGEAALPPPDDEDPFGLGTPGHR